MLVYYYSVEIGVYDFLPIMIDPRPTGLIYDIFVRGMAGVFSFLLTFISIFYRSQQGRFAVERICSSGFKTVLFYDDCNIYFILEMGEIF